MLLTYVDESYTDGWFAMAALLVDGPEAVTLTDQLGRVAMAAAKAYGLGAGVELHGHEIFHGGGAWKGVPVRARVGVFDDVVEAIAARDVRVIARAMDVVGQRARYRVPDPAHTVVLQHLLERVDECATSLGDYALVITDEVDGQARHRADLSSYREVGTTGYRHRKLDPNRRHAAFRSEPRQSPGPSRRCDHFSLAASVHPPMIEAQRSTHTQ